MIKLVSSLALVAALASPAAAQEAMTKDASKVEAGSYTVEPNHTRVTFGVSHMGFTTYYGEFVKSSGSLTLDPKKPDGSTFNIMVAADSVMVPNEKLLGELKSDQWLDSGKYSDISFKSTKITKTGPETAKVTGDFTLHGVTKPLTLDVKFNAAGANPISKAYTVGFDADGKIKRSDFGVKTYVPVIGDEVDIKISAAFEKQK